MNLRERTILLGVSGGIAAYKAAQLASDFIKAGARVHVLMTENATQFVAPLTFQTLTGNPVPVDTFAKNFQWNVEHVALAKQAELCVVAPATANVIAKMAAGICDDMLTTTLLACRCPKLVCPAMNTGMYENPATQRNLRILQDDGVMVVEPGVGRLACGDDGRGRLAGLSEIEAAVERLLCPEQDLAGLRVLVTAGPTREAIDPVRYITNRSSGRMGYELARAAAERGAQVTLVSGPVSIAPPQGVQLVGVESSQQMFEAVASRQAQCDIIIKAAAPADYTPAEVSGQKIKKGEGELTLSLRRTQDILLWLGEHKRPGQLLCGFSAETEHLLENSRGKLERKHADLIVANNITEEGAGFGVDTNIATLLTREGDEPLPKMTKRALADRILDRLLAMR